MELVCSIEAGTATEWQAALLAYSRPLAGEAAPLTVLSAGGPPTEPLTDCRVVVTPNCRHADGGDYPALNKPYSLRAWLDTNPATADVLCILDPDMALFAPLPALSVGDGCMASQVFPPDIRVVLTDSLVRQLTRQPSLLRAAGVPHWITRHDLEAVVPGWITQTERLRRDGRLHFAWVAEMIGLQLAIADCGISQRLVDVACGPGLLHYFRGACGMRWYKGTYRPWEPVSVDRREAPEARRLLALLNEYAALRRRVSAGLMAPPLRRSR